MKFKEIVYLSNTLYISTNTFGQKYMSRYTVIGVNVLISQYEFQIKYILVYTEYMPVYFYS
jgi:hypothetical protein